MTLLVGMLLSALLTYGMMFLMQMKNQQLIKGVQDDQRAQIRELLNRIQSKDLHAFATMQTNTLPVSSDDKIYPRSDEAEAMRLLEMYGNAEGIGDVIYSDEDQDLLADLGH